MAETAAPPRPAKVAQGPGYDEDFVLWTQRQAALIRAGQLDLIDWENVLKWQFQPMHRSHSWRNTIRSQRGRIERVLKEGPSLRRELAGLSRAEYATARAAASSETGFALRTFPKSLPYSPEQILDAEFFPGPIDETS